MMKRARWHFVFILLLLVGSVWFGYLAAFNWWAAGAPPTPHADTYANRGNVFFALACILLLASIGYGSYLFWARRRLNSGSQKSMH